MSGLLNNSLFLSTAAAAGGYQVERSLRFNSSDSAYLSRVVGTAGNRTTWTWSGWVKRSAASAGARVTLFGAYGAANDTDWFEFGFGGGIETDDSFYWTQATLSGSSASLYRDFSAWYHIAVSYDGANIKVYVNNSLILTSAKTGNLAINGGWLHTIGTTPQSIGSRLFNGYLTNIHLIDGQALTPSSFTETDATTGQLIPKTYTGSYGTNGYNLLFADNSSNTASTLGKDTSGNGNNWTPNNLSVTAGAGNDSLVDTPTSYGTDTSAGGEVRGNYCTWNPLDKSGYATFSNGNLDAQSGASGYGTTRGTIGVNSGKWYWEVTFNSTDATNDCYIGILDITGSLADTVGGNAKGYAYWGYNGSKYSNGSFASYGASYVPGDIIGIALDLTAGTLAFYKNGASQGTAYTGLSGTFCPAFSDSGGSNIGVIANFGQRPFAYQTPGTNRPAATFLALCDTNLGTPVVAKPSTVMDVVTYTGNSTNRNITGLAFSPDLVWTKCRSSALDNKLQDVVRGATAGLISNSTGAETTDVNGVLSFNSGGYSLGIGNVYNGSGDSYVAWCWDAGTSTVTNTQGSITSSVRANASSGFSVVTWTGNGSAGATIGHSLGVAPRFVIFKARSISENWNSYHASLGASQLIALNTTNAASSTNDFNNTAPTSSVITLGSGTGNNGNGTTYVAYCFAPVAGYSSFSSYTGNGSADGPFVYTGFRPRYLLFKSSSAVTNWVIQDTTRFTYNQVNAGLLANTSASEYSSGYDVDILSNGFKLRRSGGDTNASGATYIYAAFAENPFQYARAR